MENWSKTHGFTVSPRLFIIEFNEQQVWLQYGSEYEGLGEA
jgi:hypothetical protein